MSSSTNPPRSAPLSLAAFDALRAEDEPWLAECYVEPAAFDLIAGANSVAVFGSAGSGKTALHRRLRGYLIPIDRPPLRLIVTWTPGTVGDSLEPAEAAEAEWNHILRETANALVTHIARWPNGYERASEWAQDTLRWLVQKSLRDRLSEHIATKLKESSPPAQRALRDLVENRARNPFLEGGSAKSLSAELVKAVEAIELSGICVLVGSEAFVDIHEPRPSLVAFLSSLSYFETPRFTFKLLFPGPFERILSVAGALKTRRIDIYYLRWQPEELIHLVETRLRFASGGDIAKLRQVCEDPKVADWLARLGGDSPRGWLEEVRPLVGHYLQRIRLGKSEPITSAEWRKIRVTQPPRLMLDTHRNEVTAGHRIVSLSKESMAILEYLYNNRGRVCTHKELYHEAYLALYPNTKRQTAKSLKNEYRGVIDTAILRLRKAIEPDPKLPIFVVSRKGAGLELLNAW